MKSQFIIFILFSFILLISCSNYEQAEESPELIGSYEMVSRELPDGTILEQPEIYGFMTYTDLYRHFHIYLPGENNQQISTSSVSSYSISDGEYSRTRLYQALNNQPEGSGPTYDITGSEFTVPFSRGNEAIEFLDGLEGPMLEITADSLVATLEDQFIDRWVRVE